MTETNKQSPDNSNGTSSTTEPRAIIHKQILEVSASYPEASIETLAGKVTGATPALVEKVLEKYGDPGESENQEGTTETELTGAPERDETDPNSVTDDSTVPIDSETESEAGEHQEGTSGSSEKSDTTTQSNSDSEFPVPELDSLTETQTETLRAIHENPSATQAELADTFNVTSASISQRVNSIEGFEWTNRESITEAIFSPSAEIDEQNNKRAASDGGTTSEATTTDTNASRESPEESSGSSESESNITETATTAVTQEYIRQLERLEERLERLEKRIPDQARSTPEYGGVEPALVHKVAHACMQSEQISENEELKIIQQLIGSD
jgi:hypothetical protein